MPTTYYLYGRTVADVAVTVYGRSILVDPGTEVRFFSDEEMTTELTDIRGADAIAVIAPGTLATLPSGAFPLFCLAVPEAWVFPVNAPAGAQPMLIECHQSQLLGGALGSADGVARAAAAAAQATADAATTAIGFKADLGGGTGRLSLDERPQTYCAVLQLPGTAAVGRINPGGLLAGYQTLLSYAIFTASRAPLGSAASVTVKSRTWGNAGYNTPVVIPVPVGARRVVMAMTDTLDGADKLYSDITAVGSTEPGADFAVEFLGIGADLPADLMAAPTAPTGVTVVNTSSTVDTITWAPGAGGGPLTNFHVYATLAGVVTSLADLEAGTTTYVHAYTAGQVWSAYQVIASNDDLASTAAGAGLGYTEVLPQANGTLNSSNFFTSKGSAAAAQPVVTSNRLRLTSGSTGGNAVADKVMARDIADAIKLGGEIRGIVQLSSASGGIQWLISCSDFDLSTGGAPTSYLQLTISTTGWRLASKTSGGTYTIHASGNFATALTVATDYGLRFVADLVASDGSQVLHCYQGSAATYTADPTTLTSVGSGTVPSTTRAAIPAGRMVIQQDGTQVGQTAASVYSDYGKLRFIPTAA